MRPARKARGARGSGTLERAEQRKQTGMQQPAIPVKYGAPVFENSPQLGGRSRRDGGNPETRRPSISVRRASRNGSAENVLRLTHTRRRGSMPVDSGFSLKFCAAASMNSGAALRSRPA